MAQTAANSSAVNYATEPVSGGTDWGSIIGNGLSTYAGWNASQNQKKVGDTASFMANTTFANQQEYNTILKGLMTNPGSFLDSPIYKAAFDQGTQAVLRGSAASGFRGSGNEAASLQAYGQSMAGNYLLQQEQLLAQLSGVTGSATAGLNTATQANQSSSNTLGSVLASLGYSEKDVVGAVKDGYNSIVDLFSGGEAASNGLGAYGTGFSAATPSLASQVGITEGAAGSVQGAGASTLSPTMESLIGTSPGSDAISTAGSSSSNLGTGAAAAGAGAAGSSGGAIASLATTHGSSVSTGLASSTGSAAAGSTSPFMSALGYVAPAIAAYQWVDTLSDEFFGGNTAAIAAVGKGQSVFDIPDSPMKGLREGNIGLGSGNDSSKGSGNYYLMNKDGAQENLGQDAKFLIDQYLQASSIDKANPEGIVKGYKNVTWNNPRLGTAGVQNPTTYEPKMKELYNKYGEDKWGVDYNTWIKQLQSLRTNVVGDPYSK